MVRPSSLPRRQALQAALGHRLSLLLQERGAWRALWLSFFFCAFLWLDFRSSADWREFALVAAVMSVTLSVGSKLGLICALFLLAVGAALGASSPEAYPWDTTSLALEMLLGWGVISALHPSNAPHPLTNSAPLQTLDTQKNTARLRLALEAGEMAIWDWDIASDDVYWNERHYDILGLERGSVRPSYEAWSNCVHSEDLAHVAAALSDALATGRPYQAQYRVLGENGAVRWVEAKARAEYDQDGKPTRQYGVLFDITERLEEREALKRANALLDHFFEAAPLGIAIVSPQLTIERVNRRLFAINRGDPGDFIGRRLEEALSGVAAIERHIETLRHVLKTQQPCLNQEILARIPADSPEIRSFRESFFPITIAQQTVALGVIVEDITQAKQDEEKRTLLIQELDHRVKNTLAIVQSFIQMGFREGQFSASAVNDLTGRIDALAGANDVLTRSDWKDVALDTLFDEARHACGIGHNRAALTGPKIVVPAKHVVTVALVVHELFTNAIKYGALSAPEGRVEVECSNEGAIEVIWREVGGPPVTHPMKKGFGTELIRRSIVGGLAGDVRFDATLAGLVLHARWPRSN